jgi:prepilin-type N-terminal cleavage/methylation domain-containing protein
MAYADLAKQSGLTLIELLVVIALLGVLVTMSAMSGAEARSWVDVRTAAQQVAMDLRIARLHAITEQTDHRLLFTAGAMSYRRQRLGEQGFEEVGPPRSLPRGVAIQTTTTGAGGVSFRPRGQAMSFGTVRLGAAGTHSTDVVVDIAGHVSVR